MTNILLKVNGASAVASVDGKITSGMVGLPVSIEYDNSWSNLTKTAFFRVGNQVRKREHIGTIATVPWEILRNHGKPLEIGVEGRDSDGNIVMPTIWCSVAKIHQGASGEIPAAPNYENGDSSGAEYAIIDDSQISLSTTWSSQKISDSAVKPMPRTPNMLQPVGVDSNGYLWTEPNELNPMPKTDGMTQPVGVDEVGSLWTEPSEPYALPIATHETLGGVKPYQKTNDMIQPVSVDAEGKLWTVPCKVNPMPKTEDMTQAVGVDERGSLWTTPSDGGGGDYVLPVATDETLGGVKAVDKINNMTLGVGVDEYGYLWALGDHSALLLRDEPDQHPISAITGLEEELANVDNLLGDVETALDSIIAIQNKLIGGVANE